MPGKVAEISVAGYFHMLLNSLNRGELGSKVSFSSKLKHTG